MGNPSLGFSGLQKSRRKQRGGRNATRQTVLNFAGTFDRRTYERVLRYPNGHVRLIRYPAPPREAVAVSQDALDEDYTDSWETLNVWKSETRLAGSKRRAGPSRTQATSQQQAVLEARQSLRDDNSSGTSTSASKGPQAPNPNPEMNAPPKKQATMPASPMELLRYLNSPEYKASQAALWERVRGSYEVREARACSSTSRQMRPHAWKQAVYCSTSCSAHGLALSSACLRL